MADRIVLCPATSDVVHGTMIPPDMVRDLLAISKIPLQKIQAIAAALEIEVGFLTKTKLVRLIEEVLGSSSAVASVVTALNNLPPRRLDQILAALGEWRGLARNSEKLSDRAFEQLKTKLPSLIRDYPALTRFKKSRRLRSILGNACQDIELICDARPVYSSTRDVIEGLIPLTTMKVEYEGQDEESHSLEVVLTREAVNELAVAVEKAQKKLDVLEQSIGEWIPDGLASE